MKIQNQAPFSLYPKKESDSKLLARRRFIKSAGGTAAFAAVSAFAGATPLQASNFKGKHKPSRKKQLIRKLQKRRKQVYVFRARAASREFARGIEVPLVNRDETDLTGFIGSFSKTLPHNNLGEVDKNAYKALTKAIKTSRPSDFDNIPLAPTAARRLANPQAAFAFTLTGGDSHSFPMPAAPAFDSAWEASEMAEVYLHAILRDVPFESYGSSTAVSRAVNQLNEFSDFRGPKQGGQVTAETLFRGETAGDLIGNYISQFLLLPISESGSTREQVYQVPFQNDDHMITYSDWLNILRGGAPTTSQSFDSDKRYIATGRDLAEFVHTDYSYQAYIQAALILLGLGAPRNPANPYSSSITNQGGFITFGGAEILTTVANVALNGLKAAWYHKWNVHRRLRPEVFGGRIHNHKTGAASYPIHPEMLNSSILDDIFAKNGNYLLPMAYPEGSPTHPAYPAGHAVIAGACCTVLKAFFDEAAVIENPVEVDPASSGMDLRAYSGGATLTVGNELDKLANNISLGRDIAGVHWRTDGTEGVLLGEEVAITYLREQKRSYNEGKIDFQFTGFAGNTITI